MTEPILTASTYRKNKAAPLTVALDHDRSKFSAPNAIREVLRYWEREDEWPPPDGRHFRSAQLALPTRTGYDHLADDFTYSVVLSISDPQVARNLAAIFVQIAAKLEIPWQECRACIDAHPAPCFNCAMTEAADFDNAEAEV